MRSILVNFSQAFPVPRDVTAATKDIHNKTLLLSCGHIATYITQIANYQPILHLSL